MTKIFENLFEKGKRVKALKKKHRKKTEGTADPKKTAFIGQTKVITLHHPRRDQFDFGFFQWISACQLKRSQTFQFSAEIEKQRWFKDVYVL